jgi:hypothetical protein
MLVREKRCEFLQVITLKSLSPAIHHLLDFEDMRDGFFFFFSDSKFRPAHTHSHNQGRRRKEPARSCRRGGDGPTHALPPR